MLATKLYTFLQDRELSSGRKFAAVHLAPERYAELLSELGLDPPGPGEHLFLRDVRMEPCEGSCGAGCGGDAVVGLATEGGD